MLNLLQGVRIIELTTTVLGPMAGQILADFGAEVIKVESPEGDLARYIVPRAQSGESAMFINNNRNKRSIVLNLKHKEGSKILHKLVASADVFLHNMRLSAIERLGFGPEQLRLANPRLIYCSAIGFGSNGPYAARPAYDDVIQAASGIAGLPVYTGEEPRYVPGVIADKIAALYAANAITAALLGREHSGQGTTLEVPMFEALASFVMTEHLAAASFASDAAPGYQRLLNKHRRPFRTANGWLAVLPYTENHWRRTLGEIDRDDILAQPWFTDATMRSQHAPQMYKALAEAMHNDTTEAWLAIFERLDVPHSRINTLADLLNDPHLVKIDFFKPTDGMKARARSVPQPVRVTDAPSTPDQPAPALGANSRELLLELGLSEQTIAQLAAKNIIRLAENTKER